MSYTLTMRGKAHNDLDGTDCADAIMHARNTSQAQSACATITDQETGKELLLTCTPGNHVWLVETRPSQQDHWTDLGWHTLTDALQKIGIDCKK